MPPRAPFAPPLFPPAHLDALRRAASLLQATYARFAGPEGVLARAGEAAAEVRARAVPGATLALEIQKACSNE